VSIPAAKKAKLSKRALARLERTLTRTKCAPASNHKKHAKPGAVHGNARGGHFISGGAAVKPQPPPTADILTPGSTSFIGANPAAANAWSQLSLLFARGDRPPSFLIPVYRAAGRKYHVPWPVLAAINAIETDYGRNLSTSSAGAVGWMQFMPGTWMQYAVATGDHVVANPYDPRDAIFSAARYLAANGARHDLRRAVFAYNHAKWYVDEVLWTAANIVDHVRVKGSRARVKLAAMQAMALALEGAPYVWGGGHGGWEMSGGYDCSGFVSAVLHAGGYLRAPVTTQALPLQRDVLQGPGRYITIFDRTDGGALDEDHVIIDLHGQWWESGGIAGAGVHRIKHISASYLLTFNQVLHPRAL
jgi:cell wall-associated NlpC family hydrolase